MSLYSPLDLENILLVDLAGGEGIAVYLFLAIFAFSLGKFNLGSKLTYPLFVLFAIVMASISQSFYVFALVLAGTAIFYSIGKGWQ